MVKVIGNNNRREFLRGSDVPSIVMKEEFAHLAWKQKKFGFIHYKGKWFHLADMKKQFRGILVRGKRWDRYIGLNEHETALVKIGRDGYSYTIATMIWRR